MCLSYKCDFVLGRIGQGLLNELSGRKSMTELTEWNARYWDGSLPWDTGRPSSELQRLIVQHTIMPCRVLELGCGTGTNSVWLAQMGFEVTGIDVVPLAV